MKKKLQIQISETNNGDLEFVLVQNIFRLCPSKLKEVRKYNLCIIRVWSSYLTIRGYLSHFSTYYFLNLVFWLSVFYVFYVCLEFSIRCLIYNIYVIIVYISALWEVGDRGHVPPSPPSPHRYFFLEKNCAQTKNIKTQCK